MGYVRTAGMSTAKRRARRRTALVLLSLLLLLAVSFGVAVATMQGWLTFGGEGSTDETAITTSAAPTLEPGDITINVYNSTETAGMAGRAAEALKERGYRIDQVGNADEDIERLAHIRHGPDGLEAAQALKDALPQWIRLEEIEREGDTVDLVLGDKWKDLPTAQDAADDSGESEEG